MSNEQQTAVEWYIDELEKYEKGTSEYFSIPAIQNHARRMEKEQMKGMYVEGSFAKMRYYDGLEYIDAEQYYNEKYIGNK
jgi:hypothetical protein